MERAVKWNRGRLEGHRCVVLGSGGSSAQNEKDSGGDSPGKTRLFLSGARIVDSSEACVVIQGDTW